MNIPNTVTATKTVLWPSGQQHSLTVEYALKATCGGGNKWFVAETRLLPITHKIPQHAFTDEPVRHARAAPSIVFRGTVKQCREFMEKQTNTITKGVGRYEYEAKLADAQKV